MLLRSQKAVPLDRQVYAFLSPFDFWEDDFPSMSHAPDN
jgi:hypothetical protein